MTEISPDDRRDVCAALLTMASISSSYKVESNKTIIAIWNDIRTNIPINDDVDHIATILSLGRIVDLQASQIKVDELQTIITSFRNKMTALGITQFALPELAAAYLTASCVSHSNEVETSTSIVSFWDDIRKNIRITDQVDLASAVLATGRIMDIRGNVKSPDMLAEIVENIRKEMESTEIAQVDHKELSILLLASAFVELSPKVETYRDIVKSWVELRKIMVVYDIKDVVSVILFSGKVRDLDTSMMINPSSFTDQIKLIRNAIDEV